MNPIILSAITQMMDAYFYNAVLLGIGPHFYPDMERVRKAVEIAHGSAVAAELTTALKQIHNGELVIQLVPAPQKAEVAL
jgi:hypothetical protein